jgi:hypothetical protein
MTNDEQRLISSKIISDAIADCITTIRAECDKQYFGAWDGYTTNIILEMEDASDNICAALEKGIEIDVTPEYEKLTGHEMGVCSGRV